MLIHDWSKSYGGIHNVIFNVIGNKNISSNSQEVQ